MHLKQMDDLLRLDLQLIKFSSIVHIYQIISEEFQSRKLAVLESEVVICPHLSTSHLLPSTAFPGANGAASLPN